MEEETKDRIIMGVLAAWVLATIAGGIYFIRKEGLIQKQLEESEEE